MDKQDIDTYFTTNYNTIHKAIANIKWKKRPFTQWDLEELISLTYQHLLKYKDTLSPNNIESVIINYASQNISWSESQINKMYREKTQDIEPLQYDMSDEDDQQDYEDKVELELRHQQQKTTMMQFRRTLNQVDRRLFDAIYLDHITTIKALSQKFGINQNYITTMRIRINNAFKEFVKNNN
jgi:hypothetical protein